MEAAHGDSGIGLLPYDLFAEILRLLRSRDLAGSRRVCRAWRAAVDGTALLPARLHRFFPPRAFPGVFVCRRDAASSFFAAPPSSRSSRGGGNNNGDGGGDDGSEPAVFRYPLFHYGWSTVTDNCNGLLLLGEDQDDIFLDEGRCVCNPGTGRCARLPPVPRSSDQCDGIFLAFDPAVSRHHEVFLLPQSTTQLRPEKEITARPPVDQTEQEEMWTEISSEQLHSFNLFEEENQQSEAEEEERPSSTIGGATATGRGAQRRRGAAVST